MSGIQDSVGSYNPVSALKARETAASEALKEAFAEAMRLSFAAGREANAGKTATILESLDEAWKNGTDSDKETQKPDRMERQSDQDLFREGKHSLDRSELRAMDNRRDEIKASDRHDLFDADYRERKERLEWKTTSQDAKEILVSVTTSPSRDTLPGQVAPTNPTPFNPVEFQSVSPATLDSVSPDRTPAPVFVQNPSACTQSNFIAPGSAVLSAVVSPLVPLPVNQPSIPVSVAGSASVLTIFSASGRIGSKKNEVEEKSDTEKKKEKKDRSLSLFASMVSTGETPVSPVPEDSNASDSEPLESSSGEPGLPDGIGDFRLSTKESSRNLPEEIPLESGIDRINNEAKKESGSNRSGISLQELFGKGELTRSVSSSDSFDEILRLAMQQAAASTFVPRNGTINSGPDAPPAERRDAEPMDRYRFFQRVAAVSQNATRQNGNFRIKIHPDHLGPTTVHVASKQGRLSIRFETTSEEAKDVLLEDLDSLRSVLAENGQDVEQIDVS